MFMHGEFRIKDNTECLHRFRERDTSITHFNTRKGDTILLDVGPQRSASVLSSLSFSLFFDIQALISSQQDSTLLTASRAREGSVGIL
jgi:hypothetical protein